MSHQRPRGPGTAAIAAMSTGILGLVQLLVKNVRVDLRPLRISTAAAVPHSYALIDFALNQEADLDSSAVKLVLCKCCQEVSSHTKICFEKAMPRQKRVQSEASIQAVPVRAYNISPRLTCSAGARALSNMLAVYRLPLPATAFQDFRIVDQPLFVQLEQYKPTKYEAAD